MNQIHRITWNQNRVNTRTLEPESLIHLIRTNDSCSGKWNQEEKESKKESRGGNILGWCSYVYCALSLETGRSPRRGVSTVTTVPNSRRDDINACRVDAMTSCSFVTRVPPTVYGWRC